MDAFQTRLEPGDLTFAIVCGVSQALYVLAATLQRRLPSDWRPVLNAATQGMGTISAQQILSLQGLAETAREEPAAYAFLTAQPWQPDRFRQQLRGTRFLSAFQAFLDEYGHRAVGESDVMSPRFADRPDYLLDILRSHLLSGPARSHRTAAVVNQQQAATRQAALAQIRSCFGTRKHEWLWCRWWYALLCRYLALREANRHALMHSLAGARHVCLLLGHKLTARGALKAQEDVFFLTEPEIRSCVAALERPQEASGWQTVVAARRQQRADDAALPVPLTVWPHSAGPNRDAAGKAVLYGLPISAGVAHGPVRLLRSPADLGTVRHGDIVVAPALDPGMAPIFGLAAGLVVEMGGLLSHGAIIAREYGIPAVANVVEATRLLSEAETVTVDADHGCVTRQVMA
jgi:pyruvate,water dikinase